MEFRFSGRLRRPISRCHFLAAVEINVEVERSAILVAVLRFLRLGIGYERRNCDRVCQRESLHCITANFAKENGQELGPPI